MTRSAFFLKAGLAIFLLSPAQASDVRVRIAQSEKNVRIRAMDASWTIANRPLLPKQSALVELEVRCLGASRGLEVRTMNPLPRRIALTQAPVVQVDSPAGFLSWNGKRARGALRLVQTAKGCDVVNVLELEKYVDGLINSEFRADWEEEAVAAQAIAARTYAAFQIEKSKKSREFDLESTIADQVYEGAEKEDFRASRAVKRTQGLVLTAASTGLPLKAYYHSTCGGHTTLPERVWGSREPGFKRSVRCTSCGDSPRFSWTYSATASEASERLVRGGLIPKGSKVSDLWILRTDDTGRATRIAVLIDSKLAPIEVEANAFRLAMGGERVRSTAFSVLRPTHGRELASSSVTAGAVPKESTPRFESKARFVFNGRGFGHGVGMCQWGTRKLAREGKDYQAILKHYYPDARLTRLSY